MPYCIFIYTHLPTSDDLHRDVIWLALFVVHLIGMGITAGVYGKALVDHIDKNTGDSSVDLDVWKVGKCEGSLFDRDACRKKIHVHTHVHARPCLLHLWPYLSLSLSLSHIDIRKHNAHTQRTHATHTRVYLHQVTGIMFAVALTGGVMGFLWLKVMQRYRDSIVTMSFKFTIAFLILGTWV